MSQPSVVSSFPVSLSLVINTRFTLCTPRRGLRPKAEGMSETGNERDKGKACGDSGHEWETKETERDRYHSLPHAFHLLTVLFTYGSNRDRRERYDRGWKGMGRRECKTEPHVVSLSLSPARSTLVSLSFTWCLISRLQSFTLFASRLSTGPSLVSLRYSRYTPYARLRLTPSPTGSEKSEWGEVKVGRVLGRSGCCHCTGPLSLRLTAPFPSFTPLTGSFLTSCGIPKGPRSVAKRGARKGWWHGGRKHRENPTDGPRSGSHT